MIGNFYFVSYAALRIGCDLGWWHCPDAVSPLADTSFLVLNVHLAAAAHLTKLKLCEGGRHVLP